MSTMTEKMSQSGSGRPATKEKAGAKKQSGARHQAGPKKGDRFHCESCGMAIQVTHDCPCDDAEHVKFECCGQPMTKD